MRIPPVRFAPLAALCLLASACAPTETEPQPDPAAWEGDPALPGPSVIDSGAAEVTVRGGDATVAVDWWLPQESADGAVPWVVLMPGFLAEHGMYADYAEHLASWGFGVVGFTFSANGFADEADHEADAGEAIAVIDWALSADSGLAGRLDPAAIATAGHSKGGKIAFFAAILDDRISVVLGLDPVDSGGPPCFIDPEGCHAWSIAPDSFEGDAGRMDELTAASVIFGAPPSPTNPEEHHASLFFGGASAPSLYLYFPDGAHEEWAAGPESEPTFTLTARTMVAWLARHLDGRTGLEPWLEGAVLEADVTAGSIEVVRR